MDAIPRDAAYAVVQAVRMLRASGHGDAAAAVEIAWEGVLAGDIADLVEHVELELRFAE